MRSEGSVAPAGPGGAESGAMRTLPLREIHRDEDNCVARVPIFAGLTPEQQQAVARLARPRLLQRGELLYADGDEPAGMSVVHTGQVALTRGSPQGRRRMIRVAGPGQTIGEQSFLTGARATDQAEALTDTRMCVFTHAALAGLMHEHPSIVLQMLRSVSERMAEAERRLALSSVDVDVRLADYLLDLPLERGSSSTVRLPLAKKDVASLIGTTPESFSRALTRLKDQGLVRVQADRVVLLDPDRLDALVAQA